MEYYAILIDGDNENSLGGGCSRDLWNISQKLITASFNPQNIYTFFHGVSHDNYADKLNSLHIPASNISANSLQNIQHCFNNIITLSLSTTITVYFHYSGHGYQIPDTNGDEVDGMDEIFLGHQMTDDYIWTNFILLLSSTTHLLCVLDACHSGSGVDMPYIWRDDTHTWRVNKHTNLQVNCFGFSISACSDSQCSMQDIGDTTGFSGSLTAAICDLTTFPTIITDPFQYFYAIKHRLSLLNQTVDLHSTCVFK